jgi:hypothetical protein
VEQVGTTWLGGLLLVEARPSDMALFMYNVSNSSQYRLMETLARLESATRRLG